LGWRLYQWSKQSNLCHDSRCHFVANISPAEPSNGDDAADGEDAAQGLPEVNEKGERLASIIQRTVDIAE